MLKIHYRRGPGTPCGRPMSQIRASSYYSAVTCAICIKIVEKAADVLIDKVLREP